MSKKYISSRKCTLVYELGKILPPPVNKPSEEDKKIKMDIFGDLNHCVYCGDTEPNQQDHFYPVIKNKRPTGHCADMWNMVPSCGKCNGSKGGSIWKEWLNKEKKTRKHPRSRVGDEKVNELMIALEKFDKEGEAKRQRWYPDKPENKQLIDNLVEKINRVCDELQNEATTMKSMLNYDP